MTRLSQPTLPISPKSDPWRADMTRVLTTILRDVINQLNSSSEGEITGATNARTAAPTTGQHAQGDFIRNSKPTAGGIFGWVCVASGTPGTWKPVTIGA